MENKNQRFGAQTLNFEQVELFKSESNKSATIALHFDTEEINQFCDFTDAVLDIVSKSRNKARFCQLIHTTYNNSCSY